jgi:hypothetical protein
MNKELLTKLQVQAGGSHYPTINPQMQERFAELIVQECVRICEQGTSTQTTSGGAADMIRNHFNL